MLLASLAHGAGVVGAVGSVIVTVQPGGTLRVFAPELRELTPLSRRADCLALSSPFSRWSEAGKWAEQGPPPGKLAADMLLSDNC